MKNIYFNSNKSHRTVKLENSIKKIYNNSLFFSRFFFFILRQCGDFYAKKKRGKKMPIFVIANFFVLSQYSKKSLCIPISHLPPLSLSLSLDNIYVQLFIIKAPLHHVECKKCFFLCHSFL